MRQPFLGAPRLVRINFVPDLPERMAEITTNPVSLGYFLAIRQLIGEGQDQLVDDAFTSNDGRFLRGARPARLDQVATLEDPGARELFEKPYHAVISTLNADGSIHTTVIWVDLEDGKVAVNSAV